MKRYIAIVLVLVTCMMGGCTGLYARLPREKDVPMYADLGRTFDGHPWKKKRVMVTTTEGQEMGLMVYDNEQRTAKEVVILIHGVGADSWSWRYMCGALTEYRVIAVDLPGCGQSDMPNKATLTSKDSPSELAGCILQALRAHLKDFPAERITLVAHSLGGAVVLRMFGDDTMRTQFQDVLGHVKALVLFAPADVTIQEMPAVMQRAATVSGVEVFLAQMFGAVPDIVAGSVRDGVVYEQCALVDIAARKMAFMTDAARRAAMQWMVNNAVPGEDGKIDWERAEYWVRQYQKVPAPCLLVWGDRDPLLDSSMGYEMQRHIPGSRLCIMEHAMHCLPLEQPMLCARLIREFLANGSGPQEVVTVTAGSPGEVGKSRRAGAGGGIEDTKAARRE
jgi:pimeloyl-ACP methyl ester carboxylesterase